MTSETLKILQLLKSGGFVYMDYTSNPIVFNYNGDVIKKSTRPFIDRLIEQKFIQMKQRLHYHYITKQGINHLSQPGCKH